MTDPKRYPFAPLAAAMRENENQACEKLRIGGSTGQEYRRRGVTAQVAERLAERVGLHPYEVWPELLDDVIAALPVCAAPGCDETFEQTHPRRRFCSERCRQNVAKAKYKRTRYQRDPEYREKLRAASAARYAEQTEYIRAHQRRYRERLKETA